MTKPGARLVERETAVKHRAVCRGGSDSAEAAESSAEDGGDVASTAR